jgi:2-amino-4-hydroxy-6-hydroxymethyldihydropteridine diphosphokinase
MHKLITGNPTPSFLLYNFAILMSIAYLLLGGNEGDRIQMLQQATSLLAATCGPIIKRSSVYETAAWGMADQAAFLNMAVAMETEKSPVELLSAIQTIETTLGRQREIKWGPRTLDIDILLYNSEIIQSRELVIPHPFLNVRRFVLVPLAEIAPNYIHPLLNKSISELLNACPDQLDVRKYE